MKKIIALTLVLGLATVSNATMQLTINNSAATSATTINVGGSVVLGIAKTIGVDGGFVDFEPASGLNIFYSLQQFIPPGTIIIDDGIIGTAVEWRIDLPSAAGQYNFAILSGLANGDVTINLWNNPGDAIVDTAAVHIVPEPMTLALLGLGGLMIRRK